MRLEPETKQIEKYSSPRGFSGCAGNYQFDDKHRDWEVRFGIQRFALPNGKAELVPGVDENVGGVILKDGFAWASSNNKLYVIDRNSLAVKQYNVSGISFLRSSAI
ncbi:hypothetical protein [Deinococcus irradiatisoli]|uniref:hypothetical protein n=1 Tax=Deinococcus irradiatisoli TaxID=2202254 RepID=UPI0011B1C95A|nr:hypothetical protein [Deinococcus irradiatisoli]